VISSLLAHRLPGETQVSVEELEQIHVLRRVLQGLGDVALDDGQAARRPVDPATGGVPRISGVTVHGQEHEQQQGAEGEGGSQDMGAVATAQQGLPDIRAIGGS